METSSHSQGTSRSVLVPPDIPKDESGLHSELNDEPIDTSDSESRHIIAKCHPVISEIFYKDLGFHRLTAIQRSCIPMLLESSGFDRFSPSSGDAVIAASTGQGKTLCYLIPITSSLFYRIAPCISVIILAPTRELVSQIAKVCSRFCTVSSASIDSATSLPSKKSYPQRSYDSSLHNYSDSHPNLPQLRVTCLSGCAPFATEMAELYGTSASPDDGPSDIVVATPGRFVEHCQTTTNSTALAIVNSVYGREGNIDQSFGTTIKSSFPNESQSSHMSLWRHVRWIVLDEVDRMLEQNYQEWIEVLDIITRQCHLRPRRIVASATMTQNPEKLHLLRFERPLFFLSCQDEGSYSVPSQLRQYWCVSPRLNGIEPLTSSMTKPLTLIYLLHELYTENGLTQKDESYQATKKRKHEDIDCFQKESPEILLSFQRPRTAIFCGSKQTAQKLSCLINIHFGKKKDLQQIPPLKIRPISLNDDNTINENNEIEGVPVQIVASNFTSSLSRKERSRLVRVFEHPPPNSVPIDVLVCSDVLARGLDISELDVVINYDPPETLRTYVHRVGRTARAGRSGTTLTIVTQEEIPKFTRMLRSNRLPGEGEITLWDLVYKHDIPKKSLKLWVDARTAHQKPIRARLARKNAENEELELNYDIHGSSYFGCLLKRLDRRLRSLDG